jgi:hypothetical protein
MLDALRVKEFIKTFTLEDRAIITSNLLDLHIQLKLRLGGEFPEALTGLGLIF